MNLRSFVPWQARIAAKLVLSRVPAGYAFWRRHALFSHGAMDRPEYAHGVFTTHFQRTPFARKRGAFVALELGPGDALLSAVIAAAHGSAACHLVDAGAFAARELGPYRRMAAFLSARGLAAPDLNDVEDLAEALRRCRASYGTRGLASLRDVPDASVDFVWSHAVLEHVRRHEFLPMMRELRRVLRPDGAASHRIDLKDHLGGGLNNLRLPSRWWEKDWMARSGFYTNRLRLSEMMELFSRGGFSAELVAVTRWRRAPIRRSALAAEFRHLSDDDLTVQDFDVLLHPA